MRCKESSLQFLLPLRALVMAALLLGLTAPASAARLWASAEASACAGTSCTCDAATPCAVSKALFARLQPGDTLILQPGEYPGFAVSAVHGSAERKITIRGVGRTAEGMPTTRIRGDLAKRRDALELVRSSHIVLENLSVTHAPRAGIRLNNSHHIEVRDSDLRENGVWGIFTNHANHFTATGNTIVGPAEQHGIYQSNSGDHVRIVGNYIVDFDGCGLHFNGDLSMGGAPGVEGDGIISDVEIRDNFLAGNGRKGGSAINLDGVERVFIEDNILVGNSAAGIAVFKHDGAIGSRDVYAQRNLLVMAPDSRWAVIFNNSGPANHFSANVIVAQHPHRGIYDVNNVEFGLLPFGKISELPFTSARNYFHYQRDLAVVSSKFRSSKHLTLSQWQRQGQDQHSSAMDVRAPLVLGRGSHEMVLPAAITRAMAALDVAANNPYRHLLSASDE